MSEASRIGVFLTQQNHGFSRGSPVRFDGSNWVLASTGGTGVGLVGSLNDANTFEFVTGGELDGLDGLTPGQTYYVLNGVLTTEATGDPIGYAVSSTQLIVGSTPTIPAPVDTSSFASTTALAAAIAAEVARADSAYAATGHNHDTWYIRSIDRQGVISVVPGMAGPVFDVSDGRQVLTS